MLFLSFSPSPAGSNARSCTICSLWGRLGHLACAPPPAATSRTRAPATRRTSSLRVSLFLCLSLSPVGPKCTRARTARALLAATTRALPQGHFTQTGLHVCLYLERTLGSASHSHFSLQSQICQIHYSAQSSALKAIKYHCSIHHIDCTILEPSTVQCITTAWMPFVQHTYK